MIYETKHQYDGDCVRFSQSNLGLAIDCSKRHPDKKCIVLIEEEPHKKLADFLQNYPNLYGMFSDLQAMKEVSVPYKVFWSRPVTDWKSVRDLVNLQVAYITLSGPLLFGLPETRANIPREIGIRVPLWQGQSSVMDFWILPEQIPQYEPYIDILVIEDEVFKAPDYILKLYREQKEFKLPVNLIWDTMPKIEFGKITGKWTLRRMTCGERCLINENKCHYCDMKVRFNNR